MKKQIILAAALAVLMQTSVFADAIEGLSAVYDVKTKTVTVSGTADANKTLMAIVPANQESGRAEDISELADGDIFAKIKVFGEVVTDETGAFYKSFPIPESADGTYTLYVGANYSEDIFNTTFQYTSPTTVEGKIGELNTADAEEAVALLSPEYAELLQLDLSVWNALGDNQLNAATLLVGSIKPAGGFDSVTALQEGINKACTAAELNACTTGEELYAKLAALGELLGIDFTAYNAIGTEETREEKQKAVCDLLCEEALPITDLEDFSKKVTDGSVEIDLTMPEDWAYLQKMVTDIYRDSLDITDAVWNQYDKLKTKADVFKNIYEESYEDINEIETLFKEEVEELYKKQTKKNTSTGGGGGGGGGGVVIPSITQAPSVATPNVPVQTPVKPKPTDDLADAEWARADMEALKAAGILSGDGTGNLYPNRQITREEFVTLVIKAFEIEEQDATWQYADVASGSWYEGFVKTAYAEGIVSGISETQFGVGCTITRQDMATILYRVAKNQAIELSLSQEPFTDMEQVSGYARDAVLCMKQSGVITGMEDGSFCPKAPATRAQTAVMLNRLLALR
ncbi:MAG: S-layer homology domain-containing protein [Ruminococcaceae bacterium]|nr:S-layer homology domain-containing protein [Oscillospiraceae bacterium]